MTPRGGSLAPEYNPGYTARMKTAISIPDPLFEAAERLARRLGVSRSELFQRAVRAFLDEHRDEGVTEALDEIYGSDASRARVDPVLEHLQASSVLREDDW